MWIQAMADGPLGRALLQSLTEVELPLQPTPAEELAQGAMT